ncbi:PPA1309 family protein [Gordonia spumicola]|uniref:PPA1309 family protein n=1 Tax=Gordonia spumicola TaxID=589161 RepID=UPI00137AE825|nr:PPA1309 family protein [Gordonia spumicola]
MSSVTFPQQPQNFSQADLGNALAQCAGYVAASPWGSPATLFALVPTSFLAAQAPDLVDPTDESPLSPVVQETSDGDLEQLLTTVSWPDAVVGCAIVTEITVLPPDAESALDRAFEPLLADPDAADAAARDAARTHPDRREARLIAGVLRTGQRLALLSLRATDDEPHTESDLRTHPTLAPNVLDALASTF